MTVQIVHSVSAATSISRTALRPSVRRSNRLSLSMSAPMSSGGTAIRAWSEAARHTRARQPDWRAEGAFPLAARPASAPRQAK